MREENQNYGYTIPSDVNLSLLIGVLKDMISEENTTIIECSNIYNRFGLECRPIVVTEGQEIIRKLFEKIKHTIKPKERETSKTNGRMGYFHFWAYDYQYNPKEVQFFTNAQIRKKLEKECLYSYARYLFHHYYFEGILQPNLDLSTMEKIISERKEIYGKIQMEENRWMQEPLEQLELTPELEPAEAPFYLMVRGYKDYDALWEKYQLDCTKLGVRLEQICKPMKINTQFGSSFIVFDVSINLDDIAELPIDYEKILILTQDKERGGTFEAGKALEDGQEH